MHGNVCEWCWDLYKDDITMDNIDPTGADSGTDRMERGGSWFNYYYFMRSASRAGNFPPNWATNDWGIRLVRGL
jgi:formylglycine-generating enzyme required for sulfatase activity